MPLRDWSLTVESSVSASYGLPAYSLMSFPSRSMASMIGVSPVCFLPLLSAPALMLLLVDDRSLPGITKAPKRLSRLLDRLSPSRSSMMGESTFVVSSLPLFMGVECSMVSAVPNGARQSLVSLLVRRPVPPAVRSPVPV